MQSNLGAEPVSGRWCAGLTAGARLGHMAPNSEDVRRALLSARSGDDLATAAGADA